jgi:molybdopterin-guanine dinucleotide biosynthesis protein A
MHTYDGDFYGEQLAVVVTGFIRPERSFSSLGVVLEGRQFMPVVVCAHESCADELIEAIHNDIRIADETLERPEHQALKAEAEKPQGFPAGVTVLHS